MSEYIEYAEYKEVKARKEHQCCECKGLIPVGEAYHFIKGFFDNKPVSYKTCYDCHNLKTEYDIGSPIEEQTAYTCLEENIRECREIFFKYKWNNILKKRNSPLKQIKT